MPPHCRPAPCRPCSVASMFCTLKNTALLKPFSFYPPTRPHPPQVRIVNSDVGLVVAGSDFITVSGLVLEASQPRGEGGAAGLAGHLGLWVQESSGVLVNE